MGDFSLHPQHYTLHTAHTLLNRTEHTFLTKLDCSTQWIVGSGQILTGEIGKVSTTEFQLTVLTDVLSTAGGDVGFKCSSCCQVHPLIRGGSELGPAPPSPPSAYFQHSTAPNNVLPEDQKKKLQECETALTSQY